MMPFSYKSKYPVSSVALSEWTFESYTNCESYVLPDGCRDIIFQYDAVHGDTWFISSLNKRPYCVLTPANASMCGLRLQPGVEIHLAKLTSWLDGKDSSLLFGSDQLDEFCTKSENLSTALDCLASGKSSVLCVAKELGVSLRSLQRVVSAGTGKTPYFWFSLARIRQAGRLLAEDKKLIEIAIESGFSDQAHMSREMKSWFGQTPGKIKSDQKILDVIAESGYG